MGTVRWVFTKQPEFQENLQNNQLEFLNKKL
jgi:hypothetical protein